MADFGSEWEEYQYLLNQNEEQNEEEECESDADKPEAPASKSINKNILKAVKPDVQAINRRKQSLRSSVDASSNRADLFSKTTTEFTEEDIIRRSELARRRKQIAQKQAEETKKTTVARLLSRSGARKKRDERRESKQLSDHNSFSGVFIRSVCSIKKQDDVTKLVCSVTFPYEIPTFSSQAPTTVTNKMCSNPKCGEIRRYICSSNKLPVCSLACYQAIS